MDQAADGRGRSQLFLCDAHEFGTAEAGHPVENADADHLLPSPHLGLHAAALIVTAGFLPGQPATGCWVGDMTVPNRWGLPHRKIGDGVLR